MKIARNFRERRAAWVMADYRFGPFVIDVRRGALLADGTERRLGPKSFALLRHLAGRAGELVGRDEIMEAVWPGMFVTEDSITQCVRNIRRALGDDAAHLLRTLPRWGYMLAAGEAAAAPDPLLAPPTGRPMVLVLPFENIGGDPEQGYFCRRAARRPDLCTLPPPSPRRAGLSPPDVRRTRPGPDAVRARDPAAALLNDRVLDWLDGVMGR